MVTSSMAGWRLLLPRTGVFSSCCLALDSSSSFPCPAFRAIAKSGKMEPSEKSEIDREERQSQADTLSCSQKKKRCERTVYGVTFEYKLIGTYSLETGEQAEEQ
ncbi:hypothetical protein STEG23_028768, partial [Scotinomys teguina]